MNVVAIIQARMGSTRLPGKVLMDLSGLPMLGHVIERTKRAETLSTVLVATTIKAQDQPIVNLCSKLCVPYTRGSEDDVLDRYFKTALQYEADVIVRITGDCPLIDPIIIDEAVLKFLEDKASVDYLSNTRPPRTFPRGLDVEVIKFKALERAWLNDNNPTSREHVTPYIYKGNSFLVRGMWNFTDLSDIRLTVDTIEDLTLLQLIFDEFDGNDFTWEQAIQLLIQNPEWLEINKHIYQKEAI